MSKGKGKLLRNQGKERKKAQGTLLP